MIGEAERWALEQSGVQIVLCTCVAAGSPRIVSSCDNIQQCIVDECGMCMEPESLVPITCSRARQVVLIGDHKQLQPVVQDHVAKSLGLNVSMFERHSKRAMMLRLQYRMVRVAFLNHGVRVRVIDMKITSREYEKPSFSLRPSKKFPHIPSASEFLRTK